jgi:hypothetical protein
MIHQLRIYELFEHNKSAFHARFRDHTSQIMRNYGFTLIAMWESKFETRTEFVYLLSWTDQSTMNNAWASFENDEEWQAIKRTTDAEHGALVGAIENRVLVASSYSPSGSQELSL